MAGFFGGTRDRLREVTITLICLLCLLRECPPALLTDMLLCCERLVLMTLELTVCLVSPEKGKSSMIICGSLHSDCASWIYSRVSATNVNRSLVRVALICSSSHCVYLNRLLTSASATSFAALKPSRQLSIPGKTGWSFCRLLRYELLPLMCSDSLPRRCLA